MAPSSLQDVATQGDELVPLTPLDAVMGALQLRVIYVFPPPTAGQVPYDLERLQAALDYPHYIGERFVDPVTGAVGILQTTATRTAGAKGSRFFKDPESELTTNEVVKQTPMVLIPERDYVKETISFKATPLSDGGLALCTNSTHALLDAEGMFTFYKLWSLRYCGAPASERPVVSHDRHLLILRGTGFKMDHPEFIPPVKPQSETPPPSAAKGASAQQQFPPTTHRPFHLSPAQLNKLKQDVSTGLQEGQYVSAIDIVTALFTILITQARSHGKDVQITTGVNARARLDPPLPPNFAGNCIFNALSSYTSDEMASVSVESVQRVALRIRASILRHDEEFMRDAIEFITQEDGKWVDMRPGTKPFFGADLMYSSWANMGMYEADFGAGKPMYVGPPTILSDGLVIIVDGIGHATGLHVIPLLECGAMERLTTLWGACELLRV